MDVTNSYHLLILQYILFAKCFQKEILDKTGIYCTIGIGSNLLLSKVAMDIEAKHTKEGITEWRYHDIPDKLWCISPLKSFWGINKNRNKVK